MSIHCLISHKTALQKVLSSSQLWKTRYLACNARTASNYVRWSAAICNAKTTIYPLQRPTIDTKGFASTQTVTARGYSSSNVAKSSLAKKLALLWLTASAVIGGVLVADYYLNREYHPILIKLLLLCVANDGEFLFDLTLDFYVV